MNDLISRQAAIEAFYKYPNIDWTTLDVLAEIKALPSAQPNLQPTCNQLATDCISRQAAIDGIHDAWMNGAYYTETINTLKRLPSAQPERKTGKWIKATGMMPPEFHGHHCCSECGNFANMEPPFGNREDLSKFCPNCGADMRGEQK